MRRALMILTMVAVVGAVSALPAIAAEGSNTPAPSAEQDFLSRINAERSSRGLRTLSWHSQAAAVARSHSEDMANDGDIYHNDRLGSQMSGWSMLGENVGMGPSVSAIHGAFMGSSSHRANILGRFTHVGIGAIERDGTLYVTEVFVTPESSGSGSSGGSGGSSSSSGDDDGDDRTRVRRTRSRQATPTSSPPAKPVRQTQQRSIAVRAANAAPVVPVAQPDPAVGLGTLAALERFASEDASIGLVGCLPRDAC